MSLAWKEGTTAFQDSQKARYIQPDQFIGSAFTSYRVVVPQNDSSWVRILEERLNELTSLPTGWDGYRGKPVSFQCAYFVANMLERLYQPNVPAPSLVPGSDGSLQVEWHRNMFDVELDVLDAQNIVATRVNCKTDDEQVIEIENDFSEIVDWITALSSKKPHIVRT